MPRSEVGARRVLQRCELYLERVSHHSSLSNMLKIKREVQQLHCERSPSEIVRGQGELEQVDTM